MTQGSILLVEDNEDDADLTLLAFKRSHLLNPVVVAEDGAIALVHPMWSLMGIGDTPAAALQALLHDARELAKEMSDDDPESLSESARALRDYVTRIA